MMMAKAGATAWWKTRPAVGVAAAFIGFSAGLNAGGETAEPVAAPAVVTTVTASAVPVTATATATATATVAVTTTVTPPPVTTTVTAPPTAEKPLGLVAQPTQAPQEEAYYKNCDAARAAGAAPIRKGEPGYRSALDRDGDGVACDA